MSLFNINWRTQANNLLPSFKRSVSLVDYITSLLEPLKTKASEWFTFDVKVKKRSKFNAQIVVLRAALNDIFGVSTAPYIDVVTETSLATHNYVYNDSENNTLYIYNDSENKPVYVYNDSEIVEGNDFTVKIPTSIYTAELDRRIKAEVTIYKLAGKRFKTAQY